ncbi:hypothetical protein Tco_1151420, partial [Tanacetum coccineum]
SRTHKLKRLYKVGRSARIISSDEASLGNQEDASKQGRIADIDADAGINLVSTHFDADTYMFGVHNLVGDEVVVESEVVVKTTIEENISATATTVSAARPPTQGISFREPSKATTKTKTTTITAVPKHLQDKGKGIMVEELVVEQVKPMKKLEQMRLDEELAFKLQVEEEEERLAREKAQQVEKGNISWDNVQALIDVGYQMAQQMQAEEQEKLSIEEKSKLFVQLLEARKKHFTAMRAKEKRNKPPTKAQKRNTMSTYLKNMAGYKSNQLKNKSFNDMDTELVKGSKLRAEGSKTRAEEISKKADAKITQKSSYKRPGEDLQQESTKKQKVDDDQETTEL